MNKTFISLILAGLVIFLTALNTAIGEPVTLDPQIVAALQAAAAAVAVWLGRALWHQEPPPQP